MSFFGFGNSPRTRRRSSLGLGQTESKPTVSFGFFVMQPEISRQDSMALPRPSVQAPTSTPGVTGGVDWRRRRSSGLGFWNDVVDGEDVSDVLTTGVVPPQVKKSPVKKRRKIEDFSDYGKIKLGDIRRKQLKTAISDVCKNSLELRDKVLAIGKIKEASIADLFQMAEVCGLIDYALQLADDRLSKKHHK